MEDYFFTNLRDDVCGYFMAQTSDELCKMLDVSREDADSFAALSHQRTENSIRNGIWEDEIVEVITPEGVLNSSHDDHVVLELPSSHSQD